MNKITRKTTTTKISMYYNEEEIKGMLIKQSGLKGGEVMFDECSYGGVSGCWITQQNIVEEEA